MKNRMVILSVVVAIFAGIVVAIPDSPGMKPSRLAKNLPERIGTVSYTHLTLPTIYSV